MTAVMSLREFPSKQRFSDRDVARIKRLVAFGNALGGNRLQATVRLGRFALPANRCHANQAEAEE